MTEGRHRPSCAAAGCGQPATWIALGEERLGDEYLAPVDVPMCDEHALELLTETPWGPTSAQDD